MADEQRGLNELIATHLPRLVRLMDQSTLSEMEVALGDLRVTLRRTGAPVHATVQVPVGAPLYSSPSPDANQTLIAEAMSSATEPLPDGHTITAPMVGTFYLASTPNSPPFVQEGDVIEKGQTIGIIEAMKVMNEIEAEVGGRVVKLLIHNQQPVEYGQPLMIVASE